MKTHTATRKENKKVAAWLANKAIQAGEDVKGFDLAVLDVSNVFHLSDYFVIISGRSDRHVQGIVNKIQGALEQNGIKPLSIEGFDKAHWVLMDYGDVIVHVFYDRAREIYDLESLWVNARKVDAKQEFKNAKAAA